MDIKAVLFDKDGTLIDFADTFFEACAIVIDRLSNGDAAIADELALAVEFDRATNSCPASSQIVGGTSLSVAQLWHPILQRQSASHLARELDDYFDEYTRLSVRAFAYTKSTLIQLQAMDIVLGVATNDSQANAQAHLAALGIEDMFAFVAGYDSGFGAKPQPGMVTEFCRQYSLPSAQVAMVGDSINDLLAAANAGALAIGVGSGIANFDDLKSHSDHFLKDISHLPDFILNAKGANGVKQH